jgi:hypothetical protein
MFSKQHYPLFVYTSATVLLLEDLPALPKHSIHVHKVIGMLCLAGIYTAGWAFGVWVERNVQRG